MDLQFQCVRKHFFKNQQYTIFVNHDKLLIGKNHTQPKYEILLELKTVVCFAFDECSLSIPVGKKSKKFYLSNTDLKYLKQILDNRVSYANMQSFYRIVGDLGSGGYSKVLYIQDLDTKQFYAAKMQSKQRTGKSQSETVESIYNEIRILSHLDHDHILKIREVYDRGHQIAIIQQLIQGMTLQDFITSRDLPPTQRDIQIIIKQILDAVRYIHQSGFIHRDIKPENVMIDQLHIKLIDFGLATECGTTGYIAPEVMFGVYDHKCDIFSIGVVFYQLLTQEEPFGQIEQSPQFEQVQMNQINYSHLEEHQVDEVAIDLLKRLLEPDPKQRLSAQQALQHPYFKMNFCTPIKIQPMSKLNSQSTAIITPLQYEAMTPLKKQLVPKTLLDESLIFD